MTRHTMSRHDNSWFDTLSDNDLIDYCHKPPKDCEFNELRIAASVLAIRASYWKSALEHVKEENRLK